MSSKDNEVPMNFSTVWESDYWMQSNGMYCGFNMPDALKDGDAEVTHRLPPYEKRRFYLSDEYPAVPKHWVPSSGRKTSYFVPVKEGTGMWLDFNKNCGHKYEVAIVISIQGINPITGLPCTDAALEQYIDSCPKHKVAFGPHRYCEKCGYKWPKQNYLCTTGTPDGNLWLDGFRTADGVVRQYILTMDKIKGVAANIIKEDRVFAVGISFFLSVNPKPVIQQPTRSRIGHINNSVWSNPPHTLYKTLSSNGGATKGATKGVVTYDSVCINDSDNFTVNTSSLGGGTTSSAYCAPIAGAAGAGAAYSDTTNCYASNSSNMSQGGQHLNRAGGRSGGYMRSVNVAKVEVGAGANIDQQVHDDPEPLEFWRKEPESLILINYCLEKDATKIIRAGKISLEGHKESFLEGLPVGNVEKEKATV